MPLYEYKCRECGHRFEKLQSLRARAPRCPACGGRTERQISAPAIQFKGSGFYITDYARKGKGDKAGSADGKGEGSTPAAKDGGADSGTGGTGEKKADKKTAVEKKKPGKKS
ncbi:MAG: FmdB family zinc ribbon protein [Acidobacteriota bacterium]